MSKRGAITFVFDDGYAKVHKNVLPLLKKMNMPAVFAVTIDQSRLERVEKREIVDWITWKRASGAGHEIAAHGITHRDLTSLPADQLTHELAEPARLLGATTIVYPGGAHNDEVAAQAKMFYRAGRTVKKGFEHLPPKDNMRLRSYNFTRHNFSVWKANFLVLWAWLAGRWLIETYHYVDEEDVGLTHTVRTSQLESHLKFIKMIKIPVKTISSIVRSEK